MIRRAELQLSLQFADPTLRAMLPRHSVQRWLCAALDAPAEITVRFVASDGSERRLVATATSAGRSTRSPMV